MLNLTGRPVLIDVSNPLLLSGKRLSEQLLVRVEEVVLVETKPRHQPMHRCRVELKRSVAMDVRDGGPTVFEHAGDQNRPMAVEGSCSAHITAIRSSVAPFRSRSIPSPKPPSGQAGRTGPDH